VNHNIRYRLGIFFSGDRYGIVAKSVGLVIVDGMEALEVAL